MLEAIIAGVSAIVVALLGTGILTRRQTKNVNRHTKEIQTAVTDTLDPHCEAEVAELASIKSEMRHLREEQGTTNQLLAQITHDLDKRLTLLEDRQSRFHPERF